MNRSRDRRLCSKHGEMMYFDFVEETEKGAVRRYHCAHCEHEDTFEVNFGLPDPDEPMLDAA